MSKEEQMQSNKMLPQHSHPPHLHPPNNLLLLSLYHHRIFLSTWMTSLHTTLSIDSTSLPSPISPKQQGVTGRGCIPVCAIEWLTTLLTWPTTSSTACSPGLSYLLERPLHTQETPHRHTRLRRELGDGGQGSSGLCGRRPLPCKSCLSKREERRNSMRLRLLKSLEMLSGALDWSRRVSTPEQLKP